MNFLIRNSPSSKQAQDDRESWLTFWASFVSTPWHWRTHLKWQVQESMMAAFWADLKLRSLLVMAIWRRFGPIFGAALTPWWKLSHLFLVTLKPNLLLLKSLLSSVNHSVWCTWPIRVFRSNGKPPNTKHYYNLCFDSFENNASAPTICKKLGTSKCFFFCGYSIDKFLW